MVPIHLNLGFRVFYFYEGFYFLAAIATAYLIGLKRIETAGLAPQVLEGSLLWILLGAILGARVFQFLFWDLDSFLADPMIFFRFWDGGLTITGGLAGGVLGAWICFRRRKADFWAYSAAISPAVLVGQAVGRVGCFLNGDAWGIPTRLPWGISEPKYGPSSRASGPTTPCPAPPGNGASPKAMCPLPPWPVPLHPTQLYECIGELLLAVYAILLARSLRNRNAPQRKVIWLHLGGYSLLRFGLEFLHGDRDVVIWAGMTALQMGLLAFGVLSAVLFLVGDGQPGPALPGSP